MLIRRNEVVAVGAIDVDGEEFSRMCRTSEEAGVLANEGPDYVAVGFGDGERWEGRRVDPFEPAFIDRA